MGQEEAGWKGYGMCQENEDGCVGTQGPLEMGGLTGRQMVEWETGRSKDGCGPES